MGLATAIGRFFKRFRLYDPTSGVDTPAEFDAEKPSEELGPDFSDTGEPQEGLPEAELSEDERRQALQQYKRELVRKGRR
jgi:hypothetical protein